MYFPDLQTFATLAARGNLIPVCREIMADLDTPVSAFRKIDDGRYAFLLESIEGGEKWARYTFLGSSPAVVIRSKGKLVEIIRQMNVLEMMMGLAKMRVRRTPANQAHVTNKQEHPALLAAELSAFY